MTLCPVFAPSWVSIDLDTTAPLLVFDAPAQVEPPDDWIVIIRANEDLGPVALTFTDATGEVSRLGFAWAGPRTLTATLPTVGLATGAGELRVVARDRACNTVVAVRTVVINRPRALDVLLSVTHTLEVAARLDPAYAVNTEVQPALSTYLEITDGA